MHWSISQFPELEHLEPDQRARVLARVVWWTYPLVVARALVPAFLLGAFVVTAVGEASGGPAALAVGVPIAAAAGLALYAYQLARLRAVMREVIADAFRYERPPFCFGCGYNLRDSTEPRCPECGTVLPAPLDA